MIDATVGGGGHSRAILERILPGGRLLALDQDEEAIEAAREALSEFAEHVTLVRANFSQLEEIANKTGFVGARGILLDLGPSAYQIGGAAGRGFSFREDSFLDMRMDRENPVRAYDIVNGLSEERLAEILRENADERFARRIARAIAAERQKHPIETTRQLAEIVTSAIPPKARPKDVHPATKTFLAIRVETNREMEALEAGLEAAVRILSAGGRLVVLTYHGGEERRVKAFFRKYSGRCSCPRGLPVCVCGAERRLRVLARIRPDEEEIRANPRSRSGVLRAAEKIAQHPSAS